MDTLQQHLSSDTLHSYKPYEEECEKASNSYLMSVMAVMIGMPLPIVNLLASILFFAGNRSATYFVRWHCTQAMLSQLTIFVMNTVAFSWTIRVAFGSLTITNNYIAYICTIALFNLFEFIINIRAATRVRKGKHIYWWFWGPLTDTLVKPGKP
jgi:uncharacterized Tic20 family protein